MGRPPIGKRAMTAAERQRRHRHGTAFRDNDAAVTKPPVTKPEPLVTKSLDTNRAVTKPDVTKPDVTKPDVTKPAAPVTKPEDWDAAEALKVWFESTTEEEREEFANGLCERDLHDLLVAAWYSFGFNGSYLDWLYSLDYFEDTRYVRLPEGVKLIELDEWLRAKYGKGLDEDDESK
jgi:hypothetical protein